MERILTGTPDALDDYIDAVAKALALPVEDAWRLAIRANLEVSLKLARMVDDFALPDETEPAPVFSA
jgi:1-carboxybiuret hydrolase subunit AtzG-like